MGNSESRSELSQHSREIKKPMSIQAHDSVDGTWDGYTDNCCDSHSNSNDNALNSLNSFCSRLVAQRDPTYNLLSTAANMNTDKNDTDDGTKGSVTCNCTSGTESALNINIDKADELNGVMSSITKLPSSDSSHVHRQLSTNSASSDEESSSEPSLSPTSVQNLKSLLKSPFTVKMGNSKYLPISTSND